MFMPWAVENEPLEKPKEQQRRPSKEQAWQSAPEVISPQRAAQELRSRPSKETLSEEALRQEVVPEEQRNRPRKEEEETSPPSPQEVLMQEQRGQPSTELGREGLPEEALPQEAPQAQPVASSTEEVMELRQDRGRSWSKSSSEGGRSSSSDGDRGRSRRRRQVAFALEPEVRPLSPSKDSLEKTPDEELSESGSPMSPVVSPTTFGFGDSSAFGGFDSSSSAWPEAFGSSSGFGAEIASTSAFGSSWPSPSNAGTSTQAPMTWPSDDFSWPPGANQQNASATW